MDKPSNNGDTGQRVTPVAERPKLASGSLPIVTFAIGEVLEARFKVLSLLGRGGMGTVYLVEDTQSHKFLAMKTISSASASEAAAKRFRIEAEATSLLDHPNLIKVYDYGMIEGNHPYFVMDFCEGQTLAESIKMNGPLPLTPALETFLVICRAVAFAHEKGVVHRDLKPSNIMITSATSEEKGQVKVLDFGIAKVFRDETAFNTVTQSGEIIGSPHYMSPEQCMGKKIDSRSDIYSLGCVFFEALTGHPPFLADNPLTTMLKHQSEKAPSLREATLGREFPVDLEKIVATMLEKEPAARYSNLEQVADHITSLMRGEPLRSASATTEKRAFDKRLLMVAFVLIAFVSTIFLLLREPKQAHTELKEPASSLPSIEAIKQTAPVEVLPSFYSSQASGTSKMFVFPKYIGACGNGDRENYFTKALGEKKLDVPLSLLLKDRPGALAGFRNDEVRYLTMRGVERDDSALSYISHWTNLDTLDIARSSITDASIPILKHPKLISLNAADSELTVAGLQQLPPNHFRSLNIGYITNGHLLLPNLAGDKIEVLRLVKTGVVDEDLKLISQMPNIIYLDLRWNEVSDKGFVQLAKLSKLNKLYVTNTHLTAQALETIEQLPNLQFLAISTEAWSNPDKARLQHLMQRRRGKLVRYNEEVTK